MSFPGIIKENSVVEESVSHLDVFATILDYIGALDMDNSDGTSLKPMIQGQSDKINADYDQGVAIGEWDFRKPLLSNKSMLERTIDERPSFMVRKGSHKLMMQKLASSNQMDMLFNLEADPFEMNNLLGKTAMFADDVVVSKAEHLRCLLLDWMIRLDEGINGTRYFSDPASNYNESEGDIIEVRGRQKWKQIGLWSSGNENEPLEFGQISLSESSLIRHEWLYLGTRLDEFYKISSISFTGVDGLFFSVDEDNVIGRTVGKNSCESFRVTFQASEWVENPSLDATMELVLTESRGSIDRTIRIPLVLRDTHFVKHQLPEVQDEPVAATASTTGMTSVKDPPSRLGGPYETTTSASSVSQRTYSMMTVGLLFGMTVLLLGVVSI